MCSTWVSADGAWPAILRMGSNPKGTSAHRMVFWARFPQPGMGRSRRADLAGLLMRIGPLPSRRKQRTNHSEVGKRRCEWQIRLMEEGGPKGWAASPASLLHRLPTQDPTAPHPLGGLDLLGDVPLSSFWVPFCPEQPLSLGPVAFLMLSMQ